VKDNSFFVDFSNAMAHSVIFEYYPNAPTIQAPERQSSIHFGRISSELVTHRFPLIRNDVPSNALSSSDSDTQIVFFY
jgi:hypothetical protein